MDCEFQERAVSTKVATIDEVSQHYCLLRFCDARALVDTILALIQVVSRDILMIDRVFEVFITLENMIFQD